MTAIDPFLEAPASPPGSAFDVPAPAPAYPAQVSPPPAPAIPQPARRAPVNYQPNEGGWWLATDGLWYPPESMPTPAPQPAPAAQPLVSNPSGHAQTVIVQVAPQPAPTYVPPAPQVFVTGAPKSKVVAGLLAIFLGGLGVHRFYLGNSGVGIAMLLITLLSFGFLSPIVCIWAFIEGIVILTGGMKDSQGRALV